MMKTRPMNLPYCLLIVFAASLSIGVAQDTPESAPADLRELLSEALFQEEGAQDLGKAAEGYEALIKAYDRQRQFAATALFRLAEVRRKQARQEEAAALYKKLLVEFPNHDPLARLSRENLLALGAEPSQPHQPSADNEEALIAKLKAKYANNPDLIGKPNRETKLTDMEEAISKDHLKVIAYLAEREVDLDGAVARAAEHGKLAVCDLLLDKGADPNPERALFAALSQGYTNVVKKLLERGADPNLTAFGYGSWKVKAHSRQIWTPLHRAAHNGNLEQIKLLLDHGANVDVTVDEDLQITPLFLAKDDACFEHLIEAGANPHAKIANTGDTLLHFYRSNPKRLQLLLARGVDPNIKDTEKGETPLLRVCRGGVRELEVVKALIDAGADVNLADAEGSTPLHHAAHLRLLEFCRLLVTAGADVNAINKSDNTPLMLASDSRNEPYELLDFLVESGAGFEFHNRHGQRGLELFQSPNRVRLARKYLYPKWSQGSEVSVIFPEHQAEPQTFDPQLSFAEGVLQVAPLQLNTERSRFWFSPTIYRKADSGELALIPVKISMNTKVGFPEMKSGDIIEFVSDQWEEREVRNSSMTNPASGLSRAPLDRRPLEFDSILRSSISKRVAITLGDREPISMTLRGDVRLYDPLAPDVAPLARAGTLLELLLDPIARLGATVSLTREGKSIEFEIGSNELRDLRFENDDQLKVSMTPTSKDRYKHLALRSSGVALGWGATFPNESPPTLLQFLADFYRPVSSVVAGELDDVSINDFLRSDTRAVIPHPDWSRITIQRWENNRENDEIIEVDLASLMKELREASPADVRKHDITLSHGDIVNLPMKKEAATLKRWTGFDETTKQFFGKALAYDVVINRGEGDFSFLTLHYVPSIYHRTQGIMLSFPAEKLGGNKVLLPRSEHVMGGSNRNQQIHIQRGENTILGYHWLRHGDKLNTSQVHRVPGRTGFGASSPPGTTTNPPTAVRPRTTEGKRRVIMPPGLGRGR